MNNTIWLIVAVVLAVAGILWFQNGASMQVLEGFAPSAPAPTTETSQNQGLIPAVIENACGPTDGPATSISFEISSGKKFSKVIEGDVIEQLVAGKEQSGGITGSNNYFVPTTFEIRIFSDPPPTKDYFKGTFTIMGKEYLIEAKRNLNQKPPLCG